MFQNSTLTSVVATAFKAESWGVCSKCKSLGAFHRTTHHGFMCEVTWWNHWVRFLAVLTYEPEHGLNFTDWFTFLVIAACLYT